MIIRLSIIAFLADSFTSASISNYDGNDEVSYTRNFERNRNFLRRNNEVKEVNDRKLSPTEALRVTTFEQVSPSVVGVENYAEADGLMKLLMPDQKEVEQSAGSGFFWDNEGHIVTNFHVVDKADDIKITFKTSKGEWKTADTTVVGKDPSTDVALLKMKTKV